MKRANLASPYNGNLQKKKKRSHNHDRNRTSCFAQREISYHEMKASLTLSQMVSKAIKTLQNSNKTKMF